MAHLGATQERYCTGCGHPIARFSTICDKCGSIQRPAGGNGLEIPPEKLGTCRVCGEKAPEGETMCIKCVAKEAPGPDVRNIPRSKKLKIFSFACGTVGFVLIATTIGIAFGPGGAALLISFSIPGGIFLVISGSLLLFSLTPKDKIEVYPHITQKNNQV